MAAARSWTGKFTCRAFMLLSSRSPIRAARGSNADFQATVCRAVRPVRRLVRGQAVAAGHKQRLQFQTPSAPLARFLRAVFCIVLSSPMSRCRHPNKLQ
jgi:hypothetical protein